MISLRNYRILKGEDARREVLAAGTDTVFQTFQLTVPEKKGNKQEKEAEPKEDQVPETPPEEAILQDAIWKAEALLQKAESEADEVRRKAYDEGYTLGKEEGREAGKQLVWEEEQQAIKDRIHELEEKIDQYVTDMENLKEKVLEEYLDDLKNISLAIGEKIVQTSLKSSSEVIKKMILAATEKLKKTAWAKIYVAAIDDEMNIRGDAQLLKELAKLSDNVKIVIMEDTEPGTCIIELPHEIIDISVGAQMENIRDILNNARL